MEDEIEKIIHNGALRILPQDSLDTRKEIIRQVLDQVREVEMGWLKLMIKGALVAPEQKEEHDGPITTD